MTPSPAPAPARVLLLNLNGYDQPYPVYPLGLAYMDGALREAGYLTRIWDGRMSAESPEEAIESFRPDIVGLSMRNIDNVQYHNPQSFVQEVQREHPNWIVGDPPPEFLTTINKLRSRGLRGPLWEYIETLRRLQPPQAATAVRELSSS